MSLNSLGIFGDSFNVLTSLFTGLAFAGVIISVILQTQELKDAREEFSKQTETLKLQQKEMVIQSFDNKFFQMLNLFNSIIKNLYFERFEGTYRDKKIEYKQLDVLKYIYDIEFKDKRTTYNIESFQKFYSIINNKYDTSLKYYFINLYQILKYIDAHTDENDNPKEYTNIIRAQLSKNELVLLFYNALGVINFSGIRYKQLVEKYSFFEHLRYIDLNPKQNNTLVDLIIIEYDLNAFGKNIELQDKWHELKEQITKQSSQ